MKKRIFKKLVKKMTDDELSEYVAYCEGERKRVICEIEFVRRNPDLFTLEEWDLDVLFE